MHSQLLKVLKDYNAHLQEDAYIRLLHQDFQHF